MLGETNTEQFVLRTSQDGRTLTEQRIHDPFVSCTTTIALSRWDLFKALFSRQFIIRLNVRVEGSFAVTRAIMAMDPYALIRENQEIDRRSRGLAAFQNAR